MPAKMTTPLTIVLLIILAIAVVMDLLYQKIPNALTLPAIIFGLVYHTYSTGLDGFLFSAGGSFLGLGVLLFFYLTGMMGAGDVKLMGAVGSMLGPAGVFKAFLFTAIVGGIYAIVILVFRREFMQFLKRIYSSLKLSALSGKPTLLPAHGEHKASPVLCYGVAIGTGTVISLFWRVAL